MKYKDHREIVFEQFKKEIDQIVTKRGSILDIGCKDLYFSNKLNELGWHWIGMDIQKAENVLTASIENCPLPDNSIHVILASHLFEHLKNPLKGLEEMHRILQPGGILFMVTPYPCERQIFHMDKTHYFVLNENQISRLLEVSNFNCQKIILYKNESEDQNDWCLITIAGVR